MRLACLRLRGALAACMVSLLLRVGFPYLWPAGLLFLCCAGFPPWCLPLLQGMGSRARGQQWWCEGLFAPRHAGSRFSDLGLGSKPGIDRWTLKHWTTRDVQNEPDFWPQFRGICHQGLNWWVARWSVIRTSWPVIENHLLPQLPPLLTFLRPDTPVSSSQRMMLRTTDSFPAWAESATMA